MTPKQKQGDREMPQLMTSYSKNDLSQAIKFARSYSKTFPMTRVIIENFQDAGGCSVWKDCKRNHDNKEIILFLNGKRKQPIS